MAGPLFAIFDVVQIGDDPRSDAALTGRRGAIWQIREYPGQRFRYSVRSLADDDDEASGLYSEEDLRATGERAGPELFALPGGFFGREIVRVSQDCGEPQAAGRIGVVDGYTGDGGVSVRIADLDDSFIVWPQYLARTGDKMPAPPAGRPCRSTRVSVDGRVTGHTSYVIVDDLDQYL